MVAPGRQLLWGRRSPGDGHTADGDGDGLRELLPLDVCAKVLTDEAHRQHCPAVHDGRRNVQDNRLAVYDGSPIADLKQQGRPVELHFDTACFRDPCDCLLYTSDAADDL